MTCVEIAKKLKALDPTKVCVPDGIYPCLLKQLSSVLSKPLKMIYKTSPASMTLPNRRETGAHISTLQEGRPKRSC